MFDFCIKNTGVLVSSPSHCLLLIILYMPQPPYFLRMDNYPYSTRQAEFKLNTLLRCRLKVTSDGARHRASFSKPTNSVMSGFVTVSQEKQAMETETYFSTAGQQIYSLFLFRLNEMLFQELLPRSTAEFTGSQLTLFLCWDQLWSFPSQKLSYIPVLRQFALLNHWCKKT